MEPVYILLYKKCAIITNHYSLIMAHRVSSYSRELNAINKARWDKDECNRIINETGMELVHCICDCVHNVMKGDIPLTEEERKRFNKHRYCVRKLVDAKTSDRKRKHLIQEGGFLGAIIPTLVGLVGRLFG